MNTCLHIDHNSPEPRLRNRGVHQNPDGSYFPCPRDLAPAPGFTFHQLPEPPAVIPTRTRSIAEIRAELENLNRQDEMFPVEHKP